LNKKSRKEIIMKKNVCVLVPLLLVFLVSKVNADYYGPALKIPMDESEGTVVCATIPGGSATHTGGTYYALDFLPRAGVINEPILATAGGKVQYVKNSNCPNVCCSPSPGEPGYDPSLAAGCNVRINHGNGYISLYMHLEAGSIPLFVGEKVVQGQFLGFMGNTGYSSAKHLHFGTWFGSGGYSSTPELNNIKVEGIKMVDYVKYQSYNSNNYNPDGYFAYGEYSDYGSTCYGPIKYFAD
jgi:murein DD-endopeptidase MepM/ murein hydrolase activator NlpD